MAVVHFSDGVLQVPPARRDMGAAHAPATRQGLRRSEGLARKGESGKGD